MNCGLLSINILIYNQQVNSYAIKYAINWTNRTVFCFRAFSRIYQ